MKDLFSGQAHLYSQYRPTYPAGLYEYILRFVAERKSALDCATGNGQVARALAPHFERVQAIDISRQQLKHAFPAANILYSLSPAEKTAFPNDSFDLITVAQAYHWFDGTSFCREAKRIARPGAVVAIWGYDLSTDDSPVNAIIRHWNFDVLAPYWEKERMHVYNHYRDLPFDFEPLPVPDFEIVVHWSLEQLIGHLRTWSALPNITKAKGDGPFRETVDDISKAWGSDDTRQFTFAIFMKLGRVIK